MFGHPSWFYVQMSIVADVVTIDILDHFYAQMSTVTDVVTVDILDRSAMVHCCILVQVNNNRIIVE